MKNFGWLAGCVAFVCAQSVEAKKVEEPIDPGPRPSEQEFVEKATQKLLSSFFDPSAAVVEWPNGLAGGWWKPILSKKIPGWFTCGRVNGKNRMGGYVGFHSFVAVMYNGSVVYTEVGSGNYDLLEAQCLKAVSNGILPSGPLITEASAPAAAPPPPANGFAPTLGFQFSDNVGGIQVDAVTPGSVAEAAGLSTGIVIKSINGLSLPSLDFSTKVKLFEAAGNGSTLTKDDGSDVVMKRPAAPAHVAASPKKRRS